MASRLTRRYIRTGVYRTHYFECGDGPATIIGLHGGGAGSSGSSSIGPLVPYLGDGYRLLAPDGVGGFGHTDCNAPAGYGLHSRVDQLELFVDMLCLDRFTLVGNSQGAWVAARYAHLHPDRVQSLVLIGTATISKAMGIPMPETPGLKTLQQYDGTREGMERLLGALIYNRSRITAELVQERHLSSMRPGAKEALAGFFASNRAFESDPLQTVRFSMLSTLAQLTRAIPTIFIWGEEDAFAPPSLGRQLQDMLPDAEFHFVADAGHQVQTDRPEVVAELTSKLIETSAHRDGAKDPTRTAPEPLHSA